jgi:lipoate---protein ligase
MKTWRLLDTPPMTAAENMALDDTLVTLKGRGKTPDTIRFLQFSPRAVLTGYHQSVDQEVRKAYCRSEGIDINRRITGGGAIFFDESQLGWEIICDKAFFKLKIPNLNLFKSLCDPVIIALKTLGIKAAFRPRNDIEVNGRKISGTGGTESEGAFLFQGTLLTDFDADTMLKSLKIPVEKLKAKEIDSVKERVTCLKRELGRTPPLEEIKAALCAGFETGLGIALKPAGLTESEKRFFEKRLAHYRSRDWIDLVKPPLNTKEVVQGTYKTDAGMIRWTLVVGLPKKKIREIYLTGDFLSFPTRSLFDLESTLRGIRIDREAIHGIIRHFFDESRITIPGMTIDDFIRPMDQALEKIEIAKHGLPLSFCNQISVTNGSFEGILKRKPSVLLLPYCSKEIACDLRYQKGCRVCGDCSVSDAWMIGAEKKMETRCIVSFEDLWKELMKMKETGVSAFIGCCCQPFFAKHADDFERAGVPGILLDIDNTTCYDLDRAKEAYAGNFEGQTHVNLALLKAVLNVNVG